MSDCSNIRYGVVSYKGIEFECETSDDKFGQRGASYEFPLRDTPAYKALGRKQRKFSLKGFVTGKDHVAKATLIKLAVELGGTGALMHPIWGVEICACDDLSISHDFFSEIGKSSLTFSFLEAPLSLGFLSLDSLGLIGDIASEVIGLSNLALEIATPIITAIGIAGLIADTLQSSMVYLSGDNALKNYDLLQNWQSNDIIPVKLWYDLVVSSVVTLAELKDPLPILQKAVKSTAISFKSNSPLYVENDACISHVQITLLAALSQALINHKFKSIGDALNALDEYIYSSDNELQIASQKQDYALYDALSKLQSRTIDVHLAKNINLPTMVRENSHGKQNSLVLAHEIYNNSRRAIELENYNPSYSPISMGETIWRAAA